MTWTTVMLWIPAMLASVAAFLAAWVGLQGATEIGQALWRRGRRLLGPRTLPLRARGRGRVQTTAPAWAASRRPSAALTRSPVMLASAGGGLLLAALWRHPVLSPWFVLLGAATGWVLTSTRSHTRREDLRELETFMDMLRSVFTVGQSVFYSLEAAATDMPDGAIRQAVLEATRRYRADLDAERALAVLREPGLPHLSRLAAILTQVGRADESAIRSALQSLQNQVHKSRQLRDRANTVLTLTRLTLRTLQAANLTALAAVTALPMWHTFYADRPAMLIVATGMALAGSWYFASEIKRIEGLV